MPCPVAVRRRDETRANMKRHPLRPLRYENERAVRNAETKEPWARRRVTEEMMKEGERPPEEIKYQDTTVARHARHLQRTKAHMKHSRPFAIPTETHHLAPNKGASDKVPQARANDGMMRRREEGRRAPSQGDVMMLNHVTPRRGGEERGDKSVYETPSAPPIHLRTKESLTRARETPRSRLSLKKT